MEVILFIEGPTKRGRDVSVFIYKGRNINLKSLNSTEKQSMYRRNLSVCKQMCHNLFNTDKSSYLYRVSKTIPKKVKRLKMATPLLDPAKLQLVQELEIEMMSDMYNRLVTSCYRKCIPIKYHEAELGKGESVCLDRCVAKYLDVHERIGKKLSNMSQGDAGIGEVNLPSKPNEQK